MLCWVGLCCVLCFVCAFVKLLACLIVWLFVCVFVCLFVCSFVCSLVPLFVCSCVRSFVSWFVWLFACSHTLRLFVYSLFPLLFFGVLCFLCLFTCVLFACAAFSSRGSALRVPPAETRLTVYRRPDICSSVSESNNGRVGIWPARMPRTCVFFDDNNWFVVLFILGVIRSVYHIIWLVY